jgi:transcriptional regulator with XRE-family HTH domain
MTQKQFAESLGVKKQYITQLCTEGYPVSKKTVDKILNVYREIDINYFFGENNQGTTHATKPIPDTIMKTIDELSIDVRFLKENYLDLKKSYQELKDEIQQLRAEKKRKAS